MHVIWRDPRFRPAKASSGNGFAQAHDGERGKHVTRAAEEAVDSRHVDLEQARGAVCAGGGADDGDGGGGGVEADGGDDNVRNVVGCMEPRYSGCEGGEGGDFRVGKESDGFLGVSLLLVSVKGVGGTAYSASNWLGSIRSASRRRFL